MSRDIARLPENLNRLPTPVSWTNALFEVIDMRSFSNLWFWIALAVVWSSVSHWVLGVPFDMIQRARKQGGQAEADLHDMVRINVNRLLYIARLSKHRVITQFIGMISIFVTAMFGMYQNLAVGPGF